MLSLTKRVIRQIIGDKRTVVLIVFAPILILTLLSLLLGNTSYRPTIAIQESNLPQQLVSALKSQDANIININNNTSDEQYLKENQNVDAVFSVSQNGSIITMYESSTKSAKAMKVIQNAETSINPTAQMKTNFVYGNTDESTFDSMGYIFFGIISFFLIFIVSGMALVKERSSGTLERMLMTPISRQGVVGGYTAGYGIFAIIQSIVLVFFSIYVLGVHNAGSVFWVVLIMLLLAISAVAFGEMISIFANTEFQVVQLIPIAIIPQIFFSGLIPLATIPYNLGNLCYITPIYYGCTAIKKVMIMGNGLSAIWPFLLALVGYIIVLSTINILALKKYRKL